MKLLKLHLRNIASIVKLDLDFETQIVDNADGSPAKLFLICGDTGTGKSIILDGISMALYKKTPRLAGVTNPQNNEYDNGQGQELRINALEQYTRASIGKNDECYSEVEFIGIDNITYHARLTLGLNRNGKYIKPLWQVRIGSAGWQNVEARSGEPILSAIGLSFDQFIRMAMLPQGDFAKFLTGDKNEREAILEKLTNTEHFTQYGIAIKEKAREKKEFCINVKARFDELSTHVLTPDIAAALSAEQQAIDTELTELTAQITAEQKRKAAVEDVQKAVKQNDKATARIEELVQEFTLLTADLNARLDQIARLADQAASEETWLQEHSGTRPLSEHYADITKLIALYKKHRDDIKRNEATLTATRDNVPKLRKAADEAAAEQAKKKETVEAKQAEVDAVQQQIDSLNPKQIQADSKAAAKRQTDLKSLLSLLDKLREEQAAETRLQVELAKDEAELERRKARLKELTIRRNEANDTHLAANNLLGTMEMSLDEQLIALRAKLVEQHADTCPLCGQTIASLADDDAFAKVLEPMRRAEQQAKAALDKATREYDEMSKSVGALEGTIATNRQRQSERQRAVKKCRSDIKSLAPDLRYDLADDFEIDPLQVTIAQDLQAVADTIAALSNSQTQVDALRETLKPLNRQLKPLNDAYNAASTARTNADNAVKNNATAIDNCTKELERLQAELDTSRRKLAELIAEQHPEWDSDVDATAQTIASDVAEYKRHDKALADKNTSKKQAEVLVNSLKDSRTRVMQLQTDWVASAETDSATVANVSSRWTDLIVSLETAHSTIKLCGDTIAKAMAQLQIVSLAALPDSEAIAESIRLLEARKTERAGRKGEITNKLMTNTETLAAVAAVQAELSAAEAVFKKWDRWDKVFGGTRLRTLVQTHILKQLLYKANIYLKLLSDRYVLDCSTDNQQLSILVRDIYNNGVVRSSTLLSGGEKFVVSMALSLALSTLNGQSFTSNILFIDEGFGTLDEATLNTMMQTFENLGSLAGEGNRRVGVISHRTELKDRIPVQIRLKRNGSNRTEVTIVNES